MKNYNESILQSTSNGIVTLDADDRIVTANEAALRILGRRGANVLVDKPARRRLRRRQRLGHADSLSEDQADRATRDRRRRASCTERDGRSPPST